MPRVRAVLDSRQRPGRAAKGASTPTSGGNHTLVENQQRLAESVLQSEGPLDLAVAFWGKGAIKELGLERARPIRVLLELESGGTNPAEVKALMALPHVKVKQLPRLHAKAYISTHSVVVGSTNASANGLGSEGSEATRWHELAVQTSDEATVRSTKQWFERKWALGQPVSSAQITKAERLWRERQKNRPKVGSELKGILTAALNNPEEFRNRGLYVVVSATPLDKKGRADSRDYKEETGHEALGWQDWTDIPKNATLICFTEFDGAGFEWDEPVICYSPPKLHRHKSMVLVSPSWLDDGFKPGSIAQWRKALAIVAATIPTKRWNADDGLCLDLGDFADLVIAHTPESRR